MRGGSGGNCGRKVIFLFGGVELVLKVPSPCQLVLLMEVAYEKAMRSVEKWTVGRGYGAVGGGQQ